MSASPFAEPFAVRSRESDFGVAKIFHRQKSEVTLFYYLYLTQLNKPENETPDCIILLQIDSSGLV